MRAIASKECLADIEVANLIRIRGVTKLPAIPEAAQEAEARQDSGE
jgi:hypothetical protein